MEGSGVGRHAAIVSSVDFFSVFLSQTLKMADRASASVDVDSSLLPSQIRDFNLVKSEISILVFTACLLDAQR